MRIYHFKKQILGDGSSVSDQEITDADVIDIASEDNVVVSFDYDKQIDNASGTFNITLLPTKNWLNLVRSGDWISIYLSQDGSTDKAVRCLGNIDRVSQVEVINNDGRSLITYQISGRDFGKMFEKYSVWFNAYSPEVAAQQVLLESTFPVVGSTKDILTKLIDVFMGGALEQQVAAKGIADSTIDALRIPPQLAEDFGGFSFQDISDQFGPTTIVFQLTPTTVKFGDILVKNFDDVPGYKPTSSANLNVGPLWNMFNQYGNRSVNEIFTELIKNKDGLMVPALTLRVYPFTDKDFSSPSGFESIRKFEELDTVEITGDDILGTNIGVADHERFNLFFLYGDVPSAQGNYETALYSKPQINSASIKRYGLNAYIVSTSFMASTESEFAPETLKGWNDLIKHWFLENANLDSGTIQIVGNQNVRVGKRLFIKNAKTHNNKEFYIEGYSDSWSYPSGMWVQTLQVTRGKVFTDNKAKLDIEVGKSGTDIPGTSVVKTGRV